MSISENLDDTVWTPENGPKVVETICTELGPRLAALGYNVGSVRAGKNGFDIVWQGDGERLPLYKLEGPERPTVDAILTFIRENIIARLESVLKSFESPLRSALGMSPIERNVSLRRSGTGDPPDMRITANPYLLPKNVERIKTFTVLFRINEHGHREYDSADIDGIKEELAHQRFAPWFYINLDTAQQKGERGSIHIEMYQWQR